MFDPGWNAWRVRFNGKELTNCVEADEADGWVKVLKVNDGIVETDENDDASYATLHGFVELYRIPSIHYESGTSALARYERDVNSVAYVIARRGYPPYATTFDSP